MEASGEFASWYAAEHARVLGAACVAAGDVELAREATDEAFARALERWSRVSALARPGGWVTVTAVNLVRRGGRRRALERRTLRRHPVPAAAPPPSLPGEVWDAVRALPPRMRTAVALRYVADLSDADIADAMGVSVGTVASTLHDARARLREVLSDPTTEVPTWTS